VPKLPKLPTILESPGLQHLMGNYGEEDSTGSVNEGNDSGSAADSVDLNEGNRDLD